MRELLTSNADSSIRNKCGDTALHIACSLNKVEIIQLLLSFYTDPYELNDDGHAPIELCDRKALEAMESVHNHFACLLMKNRSQFTDISFTFLKGDSLLAHKAIIAARCEALHKLITTSTTIKMPQGKIPK